MVNNFQIIFFLKKNENVIVNIILLNLILYDTREVILIINVHIFNVLNFFFQNYPIDVPSTIIKKGKEGRVFKEADQGVVKNKYAILTNVTHPNLIKSGKHVIHL